MSEKSKTADGYNAELTHDCETTLVVLLQAFGSLSPTVRLVGGLVPRYLTPARPPEVPHHAGTRDVDLVLNVTVLDADGAYARLRDQLKKSGFEPYVKPDGVVSSWQWVYQVNGLPVLIEFLQHTDDPGKSGRLATVDKEGVSAMQILHAGVAHEWFNELPIKIDLPDGGGVVTEVVRHADAVAFIVLKTLAFHQRHEPKDVADLIHVMRYWGEIEALATLYATRMADPAHRQMLETILQRLEQHFCDQGDVEGWRMDGPAKFAMFHQIVEPGSEESVLEQRAVSELVSYFIKLVRVA